VSTAIEVETVLRQATLERFNIASDGKRFDCKFIEPGLVNYRDQGGGLELLKKETLDRCMATAVGNPLTVGHVMVNAENRTDVEEGIVHEYYFNAETGWYHVKGVADTDRAKRMIALKRPSCGYVVTSWGPGGTHHGIRYDREITGIKFNHLAIVDKPRYEEAVFRFNSSPMNLFKFIRNFVLRQNGADGKHVESVETETIHLTGDTLIETEVDGKKLTARLNDLGKLWMDQTKAAVEAPTPGFKGDELIDCGEGCGKVKLNELIEAYRSTRKNAAAEDEKAKADAAAKKKADDEAFARLNAAQKAGTSTPTAPSSDSMADRLERGRKKY